MTAETAPGAPDAAPVRVRIVAGTQPSGAEPAHASAPAGGPLTVRIGAMATPTATSPPTGPVVAAAIDVDAESATWLRTVIGSDASAMRAREVTVTVRRWRAPLAGWTGRLGALPGLVRQDVEYPQAGSGSARVRLWLGTELPLRTVLLAVQPALSPAPRMPQTAGPDVTVHGAPPDWLVGHPHLSWLPDRVVGRPEIRDHDLLLGADPSPAAGALTRARLLAGGAMLQVADRAPQLLVDTSVANPCGRLAAHGPGGIPARLALDPDQNGATRWAAHSRDGRLLTTGWLGEPLREAQKEKLAGVGLLHCAEPAEQVDPIRLAGLLVQLAATGLICACDRLPSQVSEVLAPELRARLAEPLPVPDEHPLVWEIRSIRQRRAALRGHARALHMAPLPGVSLLLVTSRPHYLRQALDQMDRQTYPNLELVVGWHGQPAPGPETEALIRDRAHPVVLVPLPASLTFGEALGMAAARSSGSLLSKIDDDDWYGPEHVWDLVIGYAHSGATLVGKPAEFVYLEELDTTVRRGGFAGDRYHTVVAGGTLTMSRGDLERVGGWRPLAHAEDKGLLERVLAEGGLIYRIHGVGYLYFRRSGGHTWDPGLGYFLRKSGAQWRGLLHHEEFGTAARIQQDLRDTP